ncbi:MAG TPA: HAMP domain-containing sensor histidine kinase [Trueperaceae bacterium]
MATPNDQNELAAHAGCEEFRRLNDFHRGVMAFIDESLRTGLDESFYQRLLERAVDVIPGAQAGSLLLRNPEDERFHYVAAVNYKLDKLKDITFSRDELMRDHGEHEPTVVHTFLSNNALDAERLDQLVRCGRVLDIKVSLSAPVVQGEDVAAFLYLDNFEDCDTFDAESIGMTESFASLVGVILNRLTLESALRLRQHEVERANAALNRANRLKSEFLANMSHELRTPLTAIIGFAELLKEELFGHLNERQMQYAIDIFESGNHLLSLINDILDLSKIEAGHMELYPEELDVCELVRGALGIVSERAHKAELRLHSRVPHGIAPLTADPRKLKQILYNLLTNAVKFSLPGGSVEVRVEDAPDEVIFHVQDTGVGIAAEDQDKLFKEFFQLDSSPTRRHEGTGLGLALSRRLVLLHGGRIWLHSRPGQGSTFSISIPRTLPRTKAASSQTME